MTKPISTMTSSVQMVRQSARCFSTASRRPTMPSSPSVYQQMNRAPTQSPPVNPAVRRKGASLVSTGAPLINHMPRGKLPDANKLFPHHFLKQLYMRVHPDLFHTANVNVKIPRSAALNSAGIRTATDRLDDSYLQLPPHDANEMFDLHPVTSVKMRKVNEQSLASLNAITEYVKQLRLFGDTIPTLKSLPKPLSLSEPIQFYCRDTELSTGEQASFKLITEPVLLPNSQIPYMLVAALDAFLCRLLLSAGIVIPKSLIDEWQSGWKSSVDIGRYGRMKKHMPWMLEDSKEAMDSAQMKFVRRDMALQRESTIYLNQQQRGATYLEFMYHNKLVMFSESLTDEQRIQAMQSVRDTVETHFDSLGMDHWVGTRLLIVESGQDATFDWAAIRMPWNFSAKEFWFICQSYTNAIKEAEVLMKKEKAELDKESKNDASKDDASTDKPQSQSQTTQSSALPSISPPVNPSVNPSVNQSVNQSTQSTQSVSSIPVEVEYEKFGDEKPDHPFKDRSLISEIQQRIKRLGQQKKGNKLKR